MDEFQMEKMKQMIEKLDSIRKKNITAMDTASTMNSFLKDFEGNENKIETSLNNILSVLELDSLCCIVIMKDTSTYVVEERHVG